MKKGALLACKRINLALARDMIVKRIVPNRVIQLNVSRATVVPATIKKGLQNVKMRIKPRNAITIPAEQSIKKPITRNRMF